MSCYGCDDPECGIDPVYEEHCVCDKNTVTWLAVDDWNAIYVNGVLIGEQGHSLSPWTWIEVLKALGAVVEDLRYEGIAENLAEDFERFPESWPPVQ